jgi:hypothetical protein
MNLTEGWWREAVCAQIGPEFQEVTPQAAKAVCARCPVIGACMEALFVEEAGRGRTDVHGIRAGMSAPERHKLIGNLCPGCKGERDRPQVRFCSTCRPRVDDRDRTLALEEL